MSYNLLLTHDSSRDIKYGGIEMYNLLINNDNHRQRLILNIFNRNLTRITLFTHFIDDNHYKN